jgi:hypothetical protein
MVTVPIAATMLAPTTTNAQERKPGGFPPNFSGPAGAMPTPPADGVPGDTAARGGDGIIALVSVGSANGGTGGDFGANDAGSDGLSFGALAINSGNRQISVVLRGATANGSYDVQFVRFNDHGREDLGSVTTDDSGNVSATTSGTLSGDHRVGAFVLVRSGHDQFVSCLA